MEEKPDSKQFVASIRDELKKVTWPTRKQATQLTLTVFVLCLIVGGYVGIIDFLLAKILQVLTKLG
ncbi:preprotein translocase subunit SecE [Candidatus Roizmanbacteria bacterium RIFCSPLOWO2_01_FULL_39_19]|nr:MAG: preprotein translocase subunit SecE [Candidatus Roizmanbacteria bacterium RIFCSPLOWO2_01_FULL_39_19]